MSNGDIVGFSPQDANEIIRSLFGGNTSKPSDDIVDSGIWFYVGKLDAQLSPGDTNGRFTAWDEAANTATTIVIENVCLPADAESPAPYDITKLCGISRNGATGGWVLTTDYSCSSGG